MYYPGLLASLPLIPNDAIKISSLLLTALGNYLLCLCVIPAPLLGLIFTPHPDVTEHLFSLTSLSRSRSREKHGIYHLGEKILQVTGTYKGAREKARKIR